MRQIAKSPSAHWLVHAPVVTKVFAPISGGILLHPDNSHSDDEVVLLAASAALQLGEKDRAFLADAYVHLLALLERNRRLQSRAFEPAHVFLARMPEGRR